MTQSTTASTPPTWRGLPGVELTVTQLRDAVAAATSLPSPTQLDPRSFEVEAEDPATARGIVCARCNVDASGAIALDLELLRAPAAVQSTLASLWKGAERWALLCTLLPAEKRTDGEISYFVRLAVRPEPMKVTRLDALTSQIRKLHDDAASLQDEMPLAVADEDLQKKYERFGDKLEVVLPGILDGIDTPDELHDWARDTFSELLSEVSVAITAATPLETHLAVVALAAEARQHDQSLGRVLVPTVPPPVLSQLVREAPGFPVLPATFVKGSTNRYDAGSEIPNMLQLIADTGRAAVFTGTDEQATSVFHGGQGGGTDPLLPSACSVPALSLEVLAHYAIRDAARSRGGLARAIERQLAADLREALDAAPLGHRRRVLPMGAAWAVSRHAAGHTPDVPALAEHVTYLAGKQRTFGGIADRPRVLRRPTVAANFRDTFTDPGLRDWLGESLVGQDPALDELVDRLCAEVLTRPPHVPLRYCAQGIPGTGKSESAALLARRLGVPYVNIDAAGMPDFAMASTQLLGSGPGFVGSDQAGRLEKVALHHRGAVVEISDLDHATIQVRQPLGDLFLQVLESGEAQAGSGAMFSCANLLFVFTLNLPGGKDDSVYRRTGFGGKPDRKEIRTRVKNELEHLVSTAFIDRMGSPILFAPLERDSWAVICERAVLAGLELAADQMQWPRASFELDPGVGDGVVDQLGLGNTGARALLEGARQRAARAFLQLHRTGPPAEGARIHVAATPDGDLDLTIVPADAG
jgi:hypothetical protein